MDIQKLVCSNCKGALKWNQEDRTFTCENCGTKYQTDNEFTYRYVDVAEIKKLEAEAEEKKRKQKEERRWGIFTILLIILIIPIFRLFAFLADILFK